jgi:hypothetical protein
LNNFTQIQKGTHTFKFGGRVRGVKIDDNNPSNIGGSWTFTGGFGPAYDASNNPIAGTNVSLSSLERYRRTLLVQRNGLTAAQLTFCGAGTTTDCIRKLGGGAAQFSINTGNFEALVSQVDLGVYGQDDWRVRPNLTLSYGLRYENQGNIKSRYNFAPRFGFAWSPGAANATKPPKTVIRGGGGVFYNRFSENFTLTSNRFNGSSELQYVLAEPFSVAAPTQATLDSPTARPVYNLLNLFPAIPTSAQLTVIPAQQQTIYRVASNLQAPMVTLAGGQVERQLPKNITMFVGAYSYRISHVIRARDVNAPLPGTISAATPNGIRPNPALGDINEYESSGKFRLWQAMTGFNSRLNPRISLQGTYVWSKMNNDTDGGGGFPVNSYDFTGEYGRGSGDVRHRFTLVGTISPPWWKLVFSPFIVANSGPPFNITTGRDTNLDRQYNERPSFAAAGADCTAVNIRCTRFGNFNLSPLPGEQIIPRNYGHAAGALSVNVRVSRTFGFGGEANRSAANSQKGGQSGQTSSSDTAANKRGAGGAGRGGPVIAGVGGGGRGPGGPGGGGGGPQMMTMGGPGGPGGPAKYQLTLSVKSGNTRWQSFIASIWSIDGPQRQFRILRPRRFWWRWHRRGQSACHS